MREHPAITIPDDAWTYPPSSDGSWLLTTIVVNGCPMHLEAHAVRRVVVTTAPEGGHVVRPAEADEVEPTCQLNDGPDSAFEKLHFAHDCEEQQQTVTIRGRDYVLFAHAHGD